MDQVRIEFTEKVAKILKENRDAKGKLTGLFLENPNGLQVEVCIPR